MKRIAVALLVASILCGFCSCVEDSYYSGKSTNDEELSQVSDLDQLSDNQAKLVAKKLEKKQECQAVDKATMANLQTEVIRTNKLVADGLSDVAKCEEALEAAHHTLGEIIRVPNPDTGEFELQILPDQDAIDTAEAILDNANRNLATLRMSYYEAVLNYDIAIEGMVYADIISLFNKGQQSNETVLEVLEKYKEQYRPLPTEGIEDITDQNSFPEYSGEDPQWYQDILNVLEEVCILTPMLFDTAKITAQ